MSINADALVGKNVRVTMVNDAKYEGVVFSFVQEQNMLILLRNIQDFKTTMHIARIPFIKDIETIQGGTQLPSSLTRTDQLPTLQTTNNSNLQKSLTTLIKKNSDGKNSHLAKLEGAPSGAVDCYLKLVKVADMAKWDSHDKSIRYGDYVSITSEDDWKTWSVAPVKVGGVDEVELKSQVDRVKGFLSKK